MHRHQRAARAPKPASTASRQVPANKLTAQEETLILETLNSERFIDQAPEQIYAVLLSEGTYLCSVSSMYRLLRREKQVAERRRQARHPARKVPELVAYQPGEVFTWDITKLAGPAKGTYFDAYVMIDIYSRYIVGCQVHAHESGQLAKEFMAQVFATDQIPKVVHADRGTLAALQPQWQHPPDYWISGGQDTMPGLAGRQFLSSSGEGTINKVTVKDVLIACCDGLTGFPEAIEATWARATVQTCVVHLIRAANRFVSYTDRRAVSAQLKSIYTAPSIESAGKALEDFEASELGQKYPSAVATWRNAWERFTPFLEFPTELRKVIYTTNAIESMNYQLRKVTKSRGHFPSDAATVKMLWLAICNIEDKRARERFKDAQKKGRTPRPGAGAHLVEGVGTNGWKQASQQLAMAYPERIEPYLK